MSLKDGWQPRISMSYQDEARLGVMRISGGLHRPTHLMTTHFGRFLDRNGESSGQENGVGMEIIILFRVSSRRFRVRVIWEDVYPGWLPKQVFCCWPCCGPGVYDMKDLQDVDACKPYLSIFAHFRRPPGFN